MIDSKQITQQNPLKLPKENLFCDISGFLIKDYQAFNPNGYTIVCHIGETCNGLQFFPESSTIILNQNQYSQLFQNFEQLIPNIAKDLQVSQQEASQKAYDFLSNTVIRVEPTGIQGKVYQTMKGIQNYVPVSHTVNLITTVKTAGQTGMQLVSKNPLTFVGATYVGSIFFGYVGAVAGNNAAGSIFNFTSYVLSRPMRVVEVVLNGIILTRLSETTGLPLVLNGTEELLNGKGLSLQEFKKIGAAFERICNSTVVQKAKDIYQILIK